MSCLHHFPLSGFCVDGGSLQSEVLAYGVDDFIDSHCLAFAVHYLADDTLRQFQVYFFIVYGGMRHNGNDDALQVTYTVAHVLCNIVNHFLGELQAVTVYLVAQNVLAEFYGRFLQLSHHSPFKTCNQTLFHALQQYRCTVGSEDELLAVLMQMVEDMEECILRFGHAGKFLNIIND